MTAIAHASIPADNPRQAAAVLAEMLGGEALPFPPAGPDAWMAWSADGQVELEIAPRGALLHFGPEEGEWRPAENVNRLSEVHLAICVEKSAAEIIVIGEEARDQRPCAIQPGCRVARREDGVTVHAALHLNQVKPVISHSVGLSNRCYCISGDPTVSSP